MVLLKRILIKRLVFLVVLCIINVTIYAQPEHVTPQLIQEFIEYIEENSVPLQDYLVSSEDLTTFVKTLKLTDEFKTLDRFEEYTVFAPTNTAFEQFPIEVITELFHPKNKEKLRSIVRYHIVKGRLRASSIIKAIDTNGGSEAKVMTISGLELTAYYRDEDTLFLKDDNGYEIEVLQQDILLSNGNVYKIETVLLPQVDNEFEKNKVN